MADDKILQRQLVAADAVSFGEKSGGCGHRFAIRIPKPIAIQAIAADAPLVKRLQMVDAAIIIIVLLYMGVTAKIRMGEELDGFMQIIDAIISVPQRLLLRLGLRLRGTLRQLALDLDVPIEFEHRAFAPGDKGAKGGKPTLDEAVGPLQQGIVSALAHFQKLYGQPDR